MSGDSHMYSVNIKGLFKYVLVSEYVSSWQLLSRWSLCLFDNLQVHKIRIIQKCAEESLLIIQKHPSLSNRMQRGSKGLRMENLVVKDA